MKKFILEYEADAAKDPNLKHMPAVVARTVDVVPETQARVWGEDWKSAYVVKKCVACKADVYVRPVYTECLLVCQQCSPVFMEEYCSGKEKPS